MKLLAHLRLEPRLQEMRTFELLFRVVAGFGGAFLLGSLLLALAGYDPLTAYAALARGSFGSTRALGATLNKACPIGLCALGVALAYRARLWNIGAEGQLYFGAFAATGVGLALPEATPAPVAILAILAAGALAGLIWASLAAIPRAALGMNEILTTLMLNYVAILWVSFLVDGPWADPRAFSFPYSEPILSAARMGRVFGPVHPGFAILCLGALALIIIDRRLRWGFELRLAGDAPRAAVFGGVKPQGLIIAAMAGAGALAGLAGAIEISAATGRLQTQLSPGYGFMAILVAWLAGGRPVGIILASVLFAGLLNGGFALQVSGIPPAIGTILQAAILISVLASLNLGRYRLRLAARGSEAQ